MQLPCNFHETGRRVAFAIVKHEDKKKAEKRKNIYLCNPVMY